jgi:hypothetical protein
MVLLRVDAGTAPLSSDVGAAPLAIRRVFHDPACQGLVERLRLLTHRLGLAQILAQRGRICKLDRARGKTLARNLGSRRAGVAG